MFPHQSWSTGSNAFTTSSPYITNTITSNNSFVYNNILSDEDKSIVEKEICNWFLNLNIKINHTSFYDEPWYPGVGTTITSTFFTCTIEVPESDAEVLSVFCNEYNRYSITQSYFADIKSCFDDEKYLQPASLITRHVIPVKFLIVSTDLTELRNRFNQRTLPIQDKIFMKDVEEVLSGSESE